MSELNPSEKETKEACAKGWTTNLDDDRDVFIGFNADDDTDKSFWMIFRNKEDKAYLRLNEDAGFALLASLETAIEYRRKEAQIKHIAYKIRMSAEDAAKLPPGMHWELIEDDKSE